MFAVSFDGLIFFFSFNSVKMSRFLKPFVSTQFVKTTLIAPVRPAIIQSAWQKPVLVTTSRFYAKKSKENKKKNEPKAAPADEDEFVRQFNEKQFQDRFENSITQLKEHLANMRIGRANPCNV